MHAEHKSAICNLQSAIYLIFMLGAFLRVWTLGDLRHGTDEAYPAYDALRLIEGGELILRGQPSSVFLDNPPLMTYIQAVPLLVWRSVWSPSVLIVSLNTLAIAFVYRAGRDSLGARAGLLAALLFAINPWVIFFSRPTWVQGLVPFFMSVIAWGLLPALRDPSALHPLPSSLRSDSPSPLQGEGSGWGFWGLASKSERRLLIGGLALVALCGAYVQAWGALAQIVPTILIFRRSLPRRPILITAAALLAGGLIYTLTTLVPDWSASIAKLTTFSGGQAQFTLSGLNHAVRFVTGLESESIRDWQGIGGQSLRAVGSLGAHALLLTLLGVGIIYAMWAVIRRLENWRVFTALLIWFFVPVLLASYSAHPIHPHYLMISLPAGHLLAGWGIDRLWGFVRPHPPTPSPIGRGGVKRSETGVRLVTAILLTAITLIFALNVGATGQYVRAMPMNPDFNGWPLARDAQLGATIRALTEGQTPPRRVAATGEVSTLSSIAATYLDVYEEVDYPAYVILPGDEPMLYVLANREVVPGVLGPHEELLPDLAIQPAVGVRVEFVRVQPYSRDEALALPETPVDLPTEAGLSLLGYTVSVGTEAIQVTSYWRVEELHEARGGWFVTAFHHLLAADGTQITNVGGHGQWGLRWRIGDVYVERAAIPLPSDLPSGPYTLELGLFDPIHSLNFLLAAPDGPVSAIMIPIILVQE